MLIKKMFRDMKKNWFPFVSILILSYLALFLYTGMSCSNIGIRQLRSEYHKETNLADIWIYGMDMTDDICSKIDAISDVDDSQLRMKLTAESTEGYQIDLYAEKENNITVPYNMDGADFDAGAQQGIWLNSRYAKAHDINVGDMFTIKWNGIEISQEVKGFIMSPEYEYYKAPEDVEPDFSHMGYAYMSYDSLKEILGDTMPSYNQIVVTIGNANASEVENDITAAIDDNYSQIFDQSNFNGLTAFDSELSQHDMFAYAFPIIFILIAILTIITTMGRIINNQRTQIGTMKALGIKRHKIIIHYIMFSLVVSAVGCIVGVITGPIVMGPVFNDFMPESYSMPKWGYSYSIKFYIVALAIVVICAFASYINCRKLINLNTVEILYARAPKDAKNCLFEKLPFWKRFKFATKYNLRDMARAKIRSIIVVIGIGCGTILILCALGCNDTMDGMKSWMFDDLMKYDSSIRISTLTPKEEYTKIAEDEDGELLMSSSVEVRSDNGKETAKTGLTVPQSDKLYTITDTNKKVCGLKDDEIYITENFAKEHGVKTGDELEIRTSGENEWKKVKVTGLIKNPNNQGIVMLESTLEKNGIDFVPTTIITSKSVDENKYVNSDYVISVSSKSDMVKSWESNIEIFDVIIMIFVSFSFVLVFIVLQNAATLSFNERRKEFATLKVMGVKHTDLKKILRAQNLWLTIVGILAGMPFAIYVLRLMFETNGGDVDYVAEITPLTYIISAIITYIVSLAINTILSRKVRKIDMAESMKATE
nr:ABC transporter permease [uncultured Agathobacter sp.]